MRVYNLTPRALEYRGKTLVPGGGAEFPKLKPSPRDEGLVHARVISLDSLPAWYLDQRARAQKAKKAPTPTVKKSSTPPATIVKAPPSILENQPALAPTPEAEPAFERVGRRVRREKDEE